MRKRLSYVKQLTRLKDPSSCGDESKETSCQGESINEVMDETKAKVIHKERPTTKVKNSLLKL